MTTFITPMDPGGGDGPRLAVKDLIDVAGVPTTAGCRAVAEDAVPAAADAACMAGARAAGARIVGKANLFELAYGASGINEWWGTPRNPLDPRLVPGGSSSGSAVAVAAGDAEVAYGSDTGGSIRVPSAFCGTAGLKTTHGRVSVAGVWPLAPSLDTVGPMARDVAGLVLGMSLLEPGFDAVAEPALAIGRLQVSGVVVDEAIDAAVDEALRRAGFDIVEVTLPEWTDAYRWNAVLLDWEAARSNRHLMRDSAKRAGLGKLVASRLEEAGRVTDDEVSAGRHFQARWRTGLADLFRGVQVLAGPTVGFFPPPLDQANGPRYTALTSPVNLAGLPAAAIPVPVPGGSVLPASVQLIGPEGAEAMLLATARVVESACR